MRTVYINPILISLALSVGTFTNAVSVRGNKKITQSQALFYRH